MASKTSSTNWCDDERAPYIASKHSLTDTTRISSEHVSTLPYVKGILDMLDDAKYALLWEEVEYCEYEFEPPGHHDYEDDADEWYDAWVIDANAAATEGDGGVDKPPNITAEYTTFCFDTLVRHKTLYT